MPSPPQLIVETRAAAVVGRLLIAAIFLGGVVLVWSAGTEGAEDILYLIGAPALVCYRVREKMIIRESGLLLEWSPFMLGPFPVVRREAEVGWGRVRRLQRSKGVVFFPAAPYIALMPKQYILTVKLGDRLLKWRLGVHTSNTREAVAHLVSHLPHRVVDDDVREAVDQWQVEVAV